MDQSLGEVAGNLIHHQVLSRDGVSFKSKRSLERREFVTSTDNWFRPTNFTNAPDGTLHVTDMYRKTIEHPWSIPDDIKAELDLESGRDRGRIYRLAPTGFQVPKLIQPGQLSTIELVTLLHHPRSWYRDTAHRLIFERQDTAAVPALRELLRTTGDSYAVGRRLALWSLEGWEFWSLTMCSRDWRMIILVCDRPPLHSQAGLCLAMHRLSMVFVSESVMTIRKYVFSWRCSHIS